jgi:hypothetical protein
MFANFSKFLTPGVMAPGFTTPGFVAPRTRLAAPAPAGLAHANDNTKIVPAAGLPRRGRPALACRWRPKNGGGFECFWVVEPASGSVTEEPDQRRPGLTEAGLAA